MFNKLFNKKSKHVLPVSVDEHVLNNLRDINIEKEKQNNKENNYVPFVVKTGPKRKDISNIVNIRFLKKKPRYSFPTLVIYLGREIAKSINVSDGDRVLFFYDTQSPKTILLKKSCAEDKNSYKVYGHISKKDCWCIRVTWPFYKPSPSHYRLTQVDTSFQDGGLLIKLYKGKWF